MPADVDILDVRRLTVSYGGVIAVDDVSLQVRSGEVLALCSAPPARASQRC